MQTGPIRHGRTVPISHSSTHSQACMDVPGAAAENQVMDMRATAPSES